MGKAFFCSTFRYFSIVDCNSSNGIKVNDSSLEPNVPHRLTPGDTVTIGSIVLTFHDDAHIPANASPLQYEKTIKAPLRSSNLNKLVTILPSDEKYEETLTIRAELEADSVDFKRVEDVKDMNVLKEDYEKLRLAYELSKVSLTNDITVLLEKSMELLFEFLPIDRGVVLLVDEVTGILAPHYVKLREGKANETREILLSSTILRKVYYSRMCLITSDAYEDPHLGKAASVKFGQIRSVICVPLIAHNKVHGILHLDSKDRINSFSNKDLALVKSISNQTAIAIENSILFREAESKARITEQLSRFLAPHVIDRMVNKMEIIRKGGREITGTIIFADIRGFTNLSETLSPAEVVNLLNDFFERVSV
jgi:adenylate cyclase